MSLNTLISTILLQLCLAPLGLAAPFSAETLDNTWQYGTGGGLLGLVVLILDVIVFGSPSISRMLTFCSFLVEVLKSSRPPVQKLIWCLVVFLFPIIGMIIYYLFSNRSAYQQGAGYETLA
ncbi:hypothetical protein N658DRAFT_437871 [Parathielavia hyrcaniae]|uniref:Cardiolipin synthase N-terminal domain-containing protein n=1 Tax=Parathielavia hyrcaniae TaxID=113614 RepID=A0AAN6PPQ2_9PEZI|nr:hypothetical protein N658DRAFT_437871 [Parathielavia hyrcaniae]